MRAGADGDGLEVRRGPRSSHQRRAGTPAIERGGRCLWTTAQPSLTWGNEVEAGEASRFELTADFHYTGRSDPSVRVDFARPYTAASLRAGTVVSPGSGARMSVRVSTSDTSLRRQTAQR